jgi:hypothetical protein
MRSASSCEPVMCVTQKHLVYSLLFTIAIVSIFILFIGYVSYSPINAQAVGRIRPLMTEKQVEEILGRKCRMAVPVPERRVRDKVFPAHTIKVWSDARAQCIVRFDVAGLVEQVSFVEDAGPGVLAWIRKTFGLR